jgi:hypothetical protein
MKFAKGGLMLEINPVFEKVYLGQGWVPVIDEDISLTAETVSVIDEPIENKTVEVAEETVENSQTLNSNESPKIYKKSDFVTLSKDKIIELAESLGYTITAAKKAEIIEEFLLQQN